MATKQELQLEILSQEYSRFVKDQVLTEVQLNEIIDVFEDQHRLTATCLIGTGIVCGLHLKKNDNTVTLSPGVAVTTDGDLLKIGETSYKYFIKYTPPDNAHYDPFYYKAGKGEKMTTLYQLLTEEDKTALKNEKALDIKELDTAIKNWVAILYLEYYLKNPEKCTPTSCDNMGMRQVSTPKLLILSKADMDKVIQRDVDETIGDDIYLKYHEAYEKYFTFPVIRARRLILNKANTLKGSTLAGAYFNAAKNGSEPLVKAIKQLYEAFRFLIDKNGSIGMKKLLEQLATKLNVESDTLYAQYTYDFYKDVVTAYNELREVLYNLAFECCPNIYAFPKHIMLGEPNIAYGPKPPAYRHQFYPSPAVSRHKVEVNVAIGMLYRLKLLVSNFNPATVDTVRITPSRDYDKPLAERAIPFYYKEVSRLAEEWNYGRTLKGKQNWNLSYHSYTYESPIPDEVLNPFDYDIDPYDFYRIEGHIGSVFSDALGAIKELRSSKGIPFDVVAVRLGDPKLSDINLDDFECQFEDLNTMLQAFQAEISCLLAEGARFFSGFTANKELPHINLKRYVAQEGQSRWVINEALFKEDAAAAVATEYVAMKASVSPGARSLFMSAADVVSEKAAVTNARVSNSALNFCQQIAKPTFTGKRIVKARIEQNVESIGVYMTQALEAEPASIDDFVEKTRKFAAGDTNLNALTEDERFVSFEYPTQIIGNLNQMQRFIPSSIREINTALISDYKEFSQSFCKKIKAMHTRLEGHFKSREYTSKGYETLYMTMLDNLSRLCCGNEKLDVIMKEIEKRKALILKHLSLASYAEEHPGLEHKAGVHRGGTFVIVYAGSGGSAVNTRSAFNRSLAGTNALVDEMQLKAQEAAVQQYRDADAFALYFVSNEESLDKEAELANFFSYQRVSAGSPVSESLISELNTRIDDIRKVFCRTLAEPEKDIVIADFCLPYLCCSDCPPVAFIMPNQPAVLTLPVGIACSNQGAIKFSACSPAGGVIASPQAPDSIIAGESPAFDPSKVPDAQIGKTITFTLDGQPTGCTIVVKKPVAIALASKISDSGSDLFTVEFINNSDETSSGPNSYLWKFNTGSDDVGKPDRSSVITEFSRAKLKELGLDTIQATVTIPGDPCGSKGTLTVKVPAPTVDKCRSFVLGFVEKSYGVLTAEVFVKRVNAVDNTKLTAIHDDVVKLLEAVPDAAGNEELVSKVAEMLKAIYLEKLQIKPDGVRIYEELLRVLLLLMLNLVRCDKDISAVNLETILMNLKQFNELKDRLLAQYPQLDFGNVLEKEIVAYGSAFVSQNPELKKNLEVIVFILSKFPES
ncbi:MAG: hypothetical protein HGB22_00240 [Chlorobiaceae bacterium]|nr:hypothetical protein [Chlorobiaceae bacterium]